MGVIGRLDKQVEDILINPVRERRKGLDEEPPPSTPESKPSEPRDEADERNQEKTRPVPDELPVWLL